VLVKSRAPNGRAAQNGDFLQDYSYEFYYLSDGAGYWVCKDGFSQKVADLPALVPGDMPAKRKFRAAQNNSISLTTSPTNLGHGTPSTNNVGTWSSPTLTITEAGFYWVSSGLYAASANLGRVLAAVNGTIVKGTPATPFSSGVVFGYMLELAAGDALVMQGVALANTTSENTQAYISDLFIWGPF